MKVFHSFSQELWRLCYCWVGV